jgi:muramoyltetrapeptide carboxypeptidase
MLLNKPNRLYKSQKIALIAPSSRITEEKINFALQNISNFGFEADVKHNFVEQIGYLSADDDKRLEYLNFYFENKKDIGAIFCIRGGYGATRLLPHIDYELISKNPIIFVGFSDITALQSAFFVKSKMPTLHGIVATSQFSDYTINQLNDLIINPKENYVLPHKTFSILNHGQAQGRIVGGNLSILCSLVGTQYLFQFKNNIVFIEDIDEPPYK